MKAIIALYASDKTIAVPDYERYNSKAPMHAQSNWIYALVAASLAITGVVVYYSVSKMNSKNELEDGFVVGAEIEQTSF